MRRMATCTVALALTVTAIGGSAAGRPVAGRPGGHRPGSSAGGTAGDTARLTARTRHAAAGPHGAAGRKGAARVRAAAGVRGGAGMKAVRFGGYTVNVPASWPVYRLGRGSAQCLRYDQHAVYLGRPGANQDCPAHLVGRVATISLQVSRAGPGARRSAGPDRSAGPGFPARPGGMSLPRVGGVVAADPQDHELRAAIADPGLSITATYPGSAAGMLKIIRSVHRSAPAAARPAAARRPAVGTTAARRGAAPPATELTRSARLAGLGHRPGAGHQAESGRQARTHQAGTHQAGPARRAGQDATASVRRRHGFDTCTAPSLTVMRAWRVTFSAAAIYLGGAEVACDRGNLSAAWVRAVTGMGWSLLPTYVGPQASCSRFSVRIKPAHAAAQGRAAANNAISRATAYGLRRGAPIYYDIEAYDSSKQHCRNAVVTFLDAWTRQLHARGYVSGVYSSASSGAEAMGAARSVNGHRVARPDSVWFGLWNDRRNLVGTPYLLSSWWRGSHRVKQYLGPHRRRVRRITLQIDSDWVSGAVYR